MSASSMDPFKGAQGCEGGRLFLGKGATQEIEINMHHQFFPLSLVRYLLPPLAWFVSCDWLSSYAVARQELPYLSILQN